MLVKLIAVMAAVCISFTSVVAQESEVTKWARTHPPRFENFQVGEEWNGDRALIRLITHSERMFKTQLANAARRSPELRWTLQNRAVELRFSVLCWCSH